MVREAEQHGSRETKIAALQALALRDPVAGGSPLQSSPLLDGAARGDCGALLHQGSPSDVGRHGGPWFETQPGARVEPGQIIGWVEGFKAISDLFCVAENLPPAQPS